MSLYDAVCICLTLIQGMDIVESLNPTAFTEYLQEFSNTICGRHPMSVLLHVRAVLQ